METTDVTTQLTAQAEAPQDTTQAPADPSASATLESPAETATAPGPVETGQPAAETVVSAEQSAAATADTAAAPTVNAVMNPAGSVQVFDLEFMRQRLAAIELHALRWGGEIGVAIRNELGQLQDHLKLR